MEKKIKNGVVDVSSFLLVEGSADSEADCGLLKLCEDVIMACDYDDEDAESCSCDTVDSLEVFDYDGTGGDQDCSGYDEAKANKECAEERNWCRLWLGVAGLEYMSTENGEEESKADAKWSKEVIDQMEDSLFWETCLAVGYP